MGARTLVAAHSLSRSRESRTIGNLEKSIQSAFAQPINMRQTRELCLSMLLYGFGRWAFFMSFTLARFDCAMRDTQVRRDHHLRGDHNYRSIGLTVSDTQCYCEKPANIKSNTQTRSSTSKPINKCFTFYYSVCVRQ